MFQSQPEYSTRRSHLDALPKTFTDMPLYFNTFSQMLSRAQLVKDTPWTAIAHGQHVVGSSVYLLVSMAGALFLGYSTQTAYARMLRERNRGTRETDNTCFDLVANGFGALYKSLTKNGAICLWLLLIADQANADDQIATKQYLLLTLLPSLLMMPGILISEFSIFSKESATSRQYRGFANFAINSVIAYAGFTSALGTSLTYFTSIDGWPKHLNLLNKNISSYLGSTAIGVSAAVMFLLAAIPMTLSLFVSTGRMVTYKTGASVFHSQSIMAWRSFKPKLVALEVKASGFWKAAVSATSAGALVYTLVSSLAKALTVSTSTAHTVGLVANFVTFALLTATSLNAQTASVRPSYLNRVTGEGVQLSPSPSQRSYAAL